jgi:pyruvate kinase
VFAFTDRWSTAGGLTLCRGLELRVAKFNLHQPDRTVDAAVEQLVAEGAIRRGDTVVVVSNVASGDRIVDGVKLRTVD